MSGTLTQEGCLLFSCAGRLPSVCVSGALVQFALEDCLVCASMSPSSLSSSFARGMVKRCRGGEHVTLNTLITHDSPPPLNEFGQSNESMTDRPSKQHKPGD